MLSLSGVAALLVAAALGVLGGGLTDELVVGTSTASSRPRSDFPGVRIEWIRPPAAGSDVRCYVLRDRHLQLRALWLCG